MATVAARLRLPDHGRAMTLVEFPEGSEGLILPGSPDPVADLLNRPEGEVA